MKIVVDFDVCEANALCMGITPEVFQVDDDDYLIVMIPEPPEEMRNLVEQAARACPKLAISIED